MAGIWIEQFVAAAAERRHVHRANQGAHFKRRRCVRPPRRCGPVEAAPTPAGRRLQRLCRVRGSEGPASSRARARASSPARVGPGRPSNPAMSSRRSAACRTRRTAASTLSARPTSDGSGRRSGVTNPGGLGLHCGRQPQGVGPHPGVSNDLFDLVGHPATIWALLTPQKSHQKCRSIFQPLKASSAA